jgi:hypothetical protein
MSSIEIEIHFLHRISIPGHEVTSVAGIIGVTGSTDTHLKYPNDVALDPQTRSLYITDSGNSRIVVLTQAAMLSSVTPTMSIFVSDNSYYCLFGVVVDSRGYVYFTERCSNLVLVASSSGEVSIFHFIE